MKTWLDLLAGYGLGLGAGLFNHWLAVAWLGSAAKLRRHGSGGVLAVYGIRYFVGLASLLAVYYWPGGAVAITACLAGLLTPLWWLSVWALRHGGGGSSP